MRVTEWSRSFNRMAATWLATEITVDDRVVIMHNVTPVAENTHTGAEEYNATRAHRIIMPIRDDYYFIVDLEAGETPS